LTDESNIRQLSSSGKAAKDRRAELKKTREERETKAKEAEAAEDDGEDAAE
jgi:hypothetical protein